MMHKEIIDNLEKKIASLTFVNDQLEAEIDCINKLLCSIGFSEGLKTVKTAAQELSEEHGLDL